MKGSAIVLVVALAISTSLAVEEDSSIQLPFVEVKSKRVVDLKDQGEAVELTDEPIFNGELMEEPMDEQELELRADACVAKDPSVSSFVAHCAKYNEKDCATSKKLCKWGGAITPAVTTPKPECYFNMDCPEDAVCTGGYCKDKAPTSTGVTITGIAITGARGTTGATGSTGARGPTGPAGVAGPKGSTGTTGARGSTGPAGAAGPKGSTGTTGARGSTGLAGAAGPKGSTGTTGARGPAGSQDKTAMTKLEKALMLRITPLEKLVYKEHQPYVVTNLGAMCADIGLTPVSIGECAQTAAAIRNKYRNELLSWKVNYPQYPGGCAYTTGSNPKVYMNKASPGSKSKYARQICKAAGQCVGKTTVNDVSCFGKTTQDCASAHSTNLRGHKTFYCKWSGK